MILHALIEQLKSRSKGDFKGRHYEASLILQAISWCLRYPLRVFLRSQDELTHRAARLFIAGGRRG
jgi:transposase-like protein